MTAMSYSPYPTAPPIAPVAHKLAAVAVPDARLPCFRIAPPPMKPTPVIRPSRRRAWPGDSRPRTAIAISTKAQLAMATSGKVRTPALRSSFSRSQPTGRQGIGDHEADQVRQCLREAACHQGQQCSSPEQPWWGYSGSVMPATMATAVSAAVPSTEMTTAMAAVEMMSLEMMATDPDPDRSTEGRAVIAGGA